MKLKILNDDGTVTIHNIENRKLEKEPVKIISSSLKEKNALEIIQAYYNDTKTILYDNTNQVLLDKIKSLNLDEFNTYNFCQMFFTSGTTGNPIGALKTKDNLINEVMVFTKLLREYNIKRVVVTVPFIHIYGTLIGLLYPLINDIDIVLKEHFLPFNLLDSIEDNSLIVTTPLYIKSLNKISDKKNLKNSVFISSTAPLDSTDITTFISKFNTNIIQLFGSTETGGIAYKRNNDVLWTPLDGVEIFQNSQNELQVKSSYVSETLYDNGVKKTEIKFQTFDYIERYENKFKLIGRSSKILKIAGKRYSTIQIENILEEQDEITNSLVFVSKSKNNLKDEFLDITLESKREFNNLEIKNILKSKISNLKFNITVKYVNRIDVNKIGKKLLIN